MGTEMSLRCGSLPGQGVLGRQGFCVRECFTPPGNELAAVVTRSHPANHQAGVRTTNNFSNRTSNRKVRSDAHCCKCLKSLVGAPGLEPGTHKLNKFNGTSGKSPFFVPALNGKEYLKVSEQSKGTSRFRIRLALSRKEKACSPCHPNSQRPRSCNTSLAR
jgi:hypothetical protein